MNHLAVEAHDELGLALSEGPKRLNDAVTQFDETMRKRPNHPNAMRALDAALKQTRGY